MNFHSSGRIRRRPFGDRSRGPFVFLFGLTSAALAQPTPLTNVELSGTQNLLLANSEFTIANQAAFTLGGGSVLTAEAGSVVDLFNSTVALPDLIEFKDVRFAGTDNQLNATSALTLLSGSTLNAAAGSTINLAQATINFPSNVVLITGSQTLIGKTLLSPIISSIISDASDDLTLQASASGASLAVGKGPNGGIALVPKGGGVVSLPVGLDAVPGGVTGILSWGGGDGPGRYTLNVENGTSGGNPSYNTYLGYNTGGAGFGDVEYRLGMESRYTSGSSSDTEFYWRWIGPTGVRASPWQVNIAWGTGARPEGYIEQSFAGQTINFGPVMPSGWQTIQYNFETKPGIASHYPFLKIGSFASLGELDSSLGSTPHNTNSQQRITGFGDKALTIGRDNIAGPPNEYMRFGGAGGGGLFAGLTNSFVWDFVGNPELRNMVMRTSTNGGASFTKLVTFDWTNSIYTFAGNLSLGDKAGRQLILYDDGVYKNSLSQHNSELRIACDSGNSTSVSIGSQLYNGSFSRRAKFSSNGVTIDATTPSTSVQTGALQVAGGAGFAGNVYVGGKLVLPGGATTSTGLWMDNSQSLYASTSNQLTYDQGGTGDAYISIRGGATNSVGIKAGSTSGGTQGGFLVWSDTANSENMRFGVGPSEVARATGAILSNGNLRVNYTTPSTTPTTGALQVAGGVGINGALNVSGGSSFGGNVLIGGTADIGGSGGLKVFGSAASASPSSGALQVVGGAGIGGAINVGGPGSFGGRLRITSDFGNTNELGFFDSTGSTHYGTIGVASTDASLSSGAVAADLVLRSQATLRLASGGATDRVVISSADGAVTVTSLTDSPSTEGGALVVRGGVAIQKKTSLGDDLLVAPKTSPAATVRLSGTAVTDTPGIWLRDGGTPTAANATLLGSSTATILNAPSGGTVNVRVGNTNYFTLTSSTATIENVSLNISSTTNSTSTTTGSATFAGGIGVTGRTSTGTLSVGAGPTVNAILSTTATLDFPLLSSYGGIHDLTVAVPGATVGNDVNVVEAGGAFAEAGVILRAIVTAAGIVTVRATNASNVAIDPTTRNYRVTVVKL